jgi:hypothetical protein
LSNLVWRRYVATNIEDWLKWLRNVHIPSYIDLTQRFINLTPAYRPDSEAVFNQEDPLLSLLWNEEFVLSLSPKGLQVWANGTVSQFLDELMLYRKFPEIVQIVSLIESNLAWFERVYAFARADIIFYLRNLGRNI